MTNPNGSKWIRNAKRERIYARDGYRCRWCLRDVARGINATLDHWVPRELGGSNHESNLLTACLSCNSRRKHSEAVQFALNLAGPLWYWLIVRRCQSALQRPLT